MVYEHQDIKSGTAFADRYKIIKLLGDGGMGKVYLAEDLVLEGEKVALKVLRPDLCQDEKHIKRFIREVQLTRKVAHPNVVRTFDIAWHEGSLYFTMEFVEGVTLRERLQQGVLTARNTMQLLLEISRGLSVIHESEIIHRDLKPGNIILSNTGVAKIADFGIARPSFTDITNQNEIIGSAGYMAPEVWTGAPLDARTDIYALGVLSYEMLTGILPFDGSSATEVMNRHLSYQPPKLETIGSDIPSWVSDLIYRMVSKDPDKRPSSAGEIISIVELGIKQRDVAPQGKPHSLLSDGALDTKNQKPTIDSRTSRDNSTSAGRRRRDFRNQTTGHKRVSTSARQRKAPERRESFGGGISIQSLSMAQSQVSSSDLLGRAIATISFGAPFAYLLLFILAPLLNLRITLSYNTGVELAASIKLISLTLLLISSILALPTWFMRWNEEFSGRIQAYLVSFTLCLGALLFASFFAFSQLLMQEDDLIKATNPDSIVTVARSLLIWSAQLISLSSPEIQFIIEKTSSSVLLQPVIHTTTFSILFSCIILLVYSVILGWTVTDDTEDFKNQSTRIAFVFLATWGVSLGAAPILMSIAGSADLFAFEGTPWTLKSYEALLAVIGWGAFASTVISNQLEKMGK